MTRVRIPVKDFRAKNKHKYIPEGEREVGMIFAPDVIFIDTVPIAEPKPEEPAAIEETETVAGPTKDWSKKKLIKEAKRLGIYTEEMEQHSFTKAKILDAINKTS